MGTTQTVTLWSEKIISRYLCQSSSRVSVSHVRCRRPSSPSRRVRMTGSRLPRTSAARSPVPRTRRHALDVTAHRRGRPREPESIWKINVIKLTKSTGTQPSLTASFVLGTSVIVLVVSVLRRQCNGELIVCYGLLFQRSSRLQIGIRTPNKRDNCSKWYETRRGDVKPSTDVGPFDSLQVNERNFQLGNILFCSLNVV